MVFFNSGHLTYLQLPRKSWNEVTAPVRAYIKGICLFAYGEKVAILPKNLRRYHPDSTR